MNDLSNNTQYPTIFHHPHVAELGQYICKILNEKVHPLKVRVPLHLINVKGEITFNIIQRCCNKYNTEI